MGIQKLKKKFSDSYQIVEKYYLILSGINNLNITNRELQLLTYCTINGSISDKKVKKGFCEKYKSSNASINNMVSKLSITNLIVKDDDGKNIVNPLIIPKFENKLNLIVTLENENKEL